MKCEGTAFLFEWTGGLTGTSTADFTQHVNCKTGRTHGQGVETFTGSVAGIASGTLTWRIHFRARFDCATFALSSFEGRGTNVSGTGGLSGLTGKFEFVEGTYAGELH